MAQTSYFELLGMPERFALDPEELEQSFHRLSRLLHPDRFGGAAPAQRRLAIQRMTLLNDAYRALKDPLRRAEYLLQREGIGDATGKPPQDPALLEAILEGRERVMELRERLCAGEPGALDALGEARAGSQEKVDELYRELGALFRAYDDGERERVVPKIVALVARIRYYTGIQQELDALALAMGQVA
jgi:molecular chaperone HscB